MKPLILLLALMLWIPSQANEAMTLIWDRSPIPLQVAPEVEREIHFTGTDLKVFVPHSLKNKAKITTQNGVVFIYGLDTFAKTRVKVHDLERNIVFLLDVTGVKKSHTHQITIQEAQAITSQATTQKKILDYRAELIRYALQQEIGIERLREPLTGVQSQAPLKTSDVVNVAGIQEKPLKAYIGGAYRVDVIQLNNHTATPQRLNLRQDIQGRWVARSLYASRLSPMGAQGDQTLLLLVSQVY